MDQHTVELLRVLQSGERSEGGLAQVRQLLDSQRRSLHASDDRAVLSDISELLEDWAETAPPNVAAAAIAHAGQIAEQDLEQAERAVQLYTSSLERDPTQLAVIDQLEALLLQLKQGAKLEPVLVKAAAALRSQGDAGAEPAASVLRRLGRHRLAQGTNLDGAISAYEQALELNAEVALIRELAELYSKRGSDGDRRQAADLYATLGEVLGEGRGTALLERALDLAPGHGEALGLLESQTSEAERAARLAPRWAAFVRASDDPLATGPRRLLLARAFGARGDHHGALEWLAPIAEQGDGEALELQAQALAAIAQADSATRTGSSAASAKAASAPVPAKGASAQSASTTPAVKNASAQSASTTPAVKNASSQSASTTPAVKGASAKSASSTPAAKSASAPAAKSTGNGPAAKKAAAAQPAAGEPAAAGKKGTAARPHTLVGFRVPASVHSADDSSAPGARKPRKPRSGDTIVGFRVPEALAATAAERAVDAAGKRAAAATSSNAASSTAPAPRSGASVSKPAASAARATGPAAAAAALRAGGKSAAAASSTGTAPAPRGGASSASARPAPGSAVAARSAPSGNRSAATLTPAQRSAALRTSGAPAHADEPAAQPMIRASSLSPAAITHASGLSPAAITHASGLSPAAISHASGLSPAAMHAVALRATNPASAPVAAATQAPLGSSPPAFAARLSHPSQPAPVQSAAMPGAAAFAQAQGALAAANAPAMIANPAAVPIPAPRSSDGERRDDELSGVRARPRFLDQRTLTIGGAVLLGVVGAVVLFSGKSAPTPPPASSADAPHADTPPAPPASAASAPANAATTGTTTASASATGASPSGSAALPSTLAAAVAPPAPAAPPPSVAAEPAPGRVEVQVSEIRITGGKLRTKDVLVALGDGLKDVEHCYEEVLEDRPKTSGALNYSFTVDRKGNPTKIKKAGGTIKDSRLLKCTARAIEKADFPKPKSKPAQVTLPLEFKKG